MSSMLRGTPSPFFVVPVLAALAVLLFAGPRNPGIRSENEVTFLARAGGTIAEGAIKNYQKDIQFDPNAPEKTFIRLTFDMRSTTTGSTYADRAALSEDFLDAERYPTAELTASGIKQVAEGKYIMDGQITLKGVTKPIQVPLSVTLKDGNAVLKGAAIVNRQDFGIGPDVYMGLMLDKDVQIRFVLNDIKLPVPAPTAEKSEAAVLTK